MKIILMRHGRTKGNTEKRYVGTTEESLLPEEISSAEQLWMYPICEEAHISENAGSENVGSENTGSENVGSENTGSVNVESENTEREKKCGVNEYNGHAMNVNGACGNRVFRAWALYREMMKSTRKKVYVSPMLRCVETAKMIFPGIPYTTVEQMRECDFGDFEYKNYLELSEDPRYQAWIDSNGTLPFPNGESVPEFKKRCQKAFEKCMNQAFTQRADMVTFVVHGGTIMSVMEKYAIPKKEYYQWQVGNLEGFAGEIEQTTSGIYQIQGIQKIVKSKEELSEQA
ncbi:MAG: histidine phosphatase family protein [Lachnospiraceae bacterium]|nr:histidine phosphatase family protein [Lachnospiraceae bacterium]